MSTSPGPTIDLTTVLSLLSTLLILATAYLASTHFLPSSTSLKTRILFIWHAFDALIHTFLEGSFLLNCFFTSYKLPEKAAEVVTSSPGAGWGWFGGGGRSTTTAATLVSSVLSSAASRVTQAAGSALASPPPLAPALRHPLVLTPPDVYFLGDASRVYGSFYGENPFAKLWQEYAKADRRWGGADLTVVSLELLTVGLGAPVAAYVCYLLVKAGQGDARSRKAGWWWMTALATGELYGGFMTFAPEWLSGNVNLDGSNWMYLWLYLVFFNMLWVVIPFWILWEAYRFITTSLVTHEEMADIVSHLDKKDS